MLVICPKCNGPRTPRTDRPTEYRCVPCERIRKNSYLKTRQGKTALKRAQKRYRAKSARLRTVHRGQNRNLIEGVCALYLPPGAIVADVTYGKGNFWRNVDTSRFTLLASDIAPRDTQTRAFDCRCLPYCSNSIDVVVLDPPYVHNPGDHITDGSYANAATTAGLYHRDIIELYRYAMKEARRVLRPGGQLWVKCKDEVESNRQCWSHIELFDLAKDLGFFGQDLFVLVTKGPHPGRWQKGQRHAH